MQSRKQEYVKPELSGATVFETAAKTCCKDRVANCKNPIRQGTGKSAVSKDVS